jgi:hypothetical protein
MPLIAAAPGKGLPLKFEVRSSRFGRLSSGRS